MLRDDDQEREILAFIEDAADTQAWENSYRSWPTKS